MSQSDTLADQRPVQRWIQLILDSIAVGVRQLLVAVLVLMLMTSSVGIESFGVVTTGSSEFAVRVRLRRSPETPGYVTYEYQFSPPDEVQQLQFDVTGERTVVRSDGFARENPMQWRWDGETATPEIVVTQRVNESDKYGMTTVATDEFAFVDMSDAPDPISWDATSEVTANLTTEVVGEGYAGDVFAYLGPVEQRTVPGDPELTFVIPEETPLKRRPETVQRELSALDDRIGIDAEGEAMTVFTPPSPIRTGGKAYSGELWVQNESPTHVYYHEYIHTQQEFINAVDDDLYWLVEASAEYYEIHARHQLEGTRSGDSVGSFNSELNASEGRSAVLTEITRSTDTLADYDKGAHVLAALDLKIRETTDGERTLDAVLRELNRRATDNQYEDPIEYAEFKQIVADVADESMDDWLDVYVDSSAIPPLPEDPATTYGTIGTNQPPSAPDYQFTTEQGEPFRVDTPGVLANASDPDGHNLIATEVEPGVVNDVVIHPDGTVVPDADTDRRVITVTYRVSDELGASGTGTVTVIIESASPQVGRGSE